MMARIWVICAAGGPGISGRMGGCVRGMRSLGFCGGGREGPGGEDVFVQAVVQDGGLEEDAACRLAGPSAAGAVLLQALQAVQGAPGAGVAGAGGAQQDEQGPGGHGGLAVGVFGVASGQAAGVVLAPAAVWFLVLAQPSDRPGYRGVGGGNAG